jgi:predicted transcriptional regulator
MGAVRKIVRSSTADDLRKLLQEVAQRVSELETRVAEAGQGAPSRGFSDDKLATLASAIYRMRQHRQSYFEAALFAEPAWDMMLDLFINKVRGARVSTTSLCLAANVPHATGIRWIRTLREHGLLRRYRAADDARLMLIEITTKGYQLMRQCLSEAVTRFELPIPG